MPRDQRAQKNVSDKVLYELEMFKRVANKTIDEWNKSDRLTKNILIEDFLLHARIMYDFLICDPESDDISALHFLDCPEGWKQVRVQLCPYMSNNRKRLNKMIAHLTYKRIEYEIDNTKDWEVRAIYHEIISTWQQFLSYLSPEQHEWFTNY
jgi:hypothetical protein